MSDRPTDIEKTATHVCFHCGAFWLKNSDESWTLKSDECRNCCDNKDMGEHILEIHKAFIEERYRTHALTDLMLLVEKHKREAEQKLSEAEDNLEKAVFRIKDMLMGDDGQAWDEAEKFLDRLNKQEGKDNG